MPHKLLILLALLLASTPESALSSEQDSADQPYYFYHALPYGSESLVGPTRMIISGGFGILQMENRSNQLDDIQWRNGWKNTWKNLLDPFASIRAKGWGKFIKSELIPFSIDGGSAQYWPNYTNHLIGGGMGYRNMREWYRHHGFEHESRWALATLTVYHMLNEVVEMNDKKGWRVDPVADMYIFNVAGVLAFENDRIARFFGETLNMRDWSFQPLYDPRNGTLEGVGQNYMMRLRLGHTTPWHLFYHWGNSGEFGLSREIGGGNSLSMGAGFVAKNLEDVDGISETANLASTFGMFWDRNGSLMASALYTKDKDYRYRFNLYPGVIKLGAVRPGLTFIVTRTKEFVAGVTLGNVPLWPVGLGSRVGNDR